MKIKGMKLFTAICMCTAVISSSFIVKAEVCQYYYSQVCQQKSQWCWAASAENSVRWERNTSRSQADAVKKLYGTKSNPYPDIAAGVVAIKTAAEYISNYNESYSYSGVKSFKFLKNEIKNSSDVTILGASYYGMNAGHVVTCVGYDNSGSTNYLFVYDPWNGVTSKVSYSYFKDGWSGRYYNATVWNVE